ncbi:type IV pilin [Haloarcula hispanica]|uniref:type IV pilin n=1 Tax=Haloarcula hispanica TaxID=51589 RepID=UPI0011B6C439|nr:type IV pilin [Haloarcula hispanica]
MSINTNGDGEDDGENPGLIHVILMVLITIILISIISSFVLSLGDQATTTPQISTNTTSYYASIEPKVVSVGEEVSIQYHLSNTGNSEKHVRISILSDISEDHSGPIVEELILRPKNRQTVSVSISPVRVEDRTKFPIVIQIVEDNSSIYYIDSNDLVVEPDIPDFKSSYGLLSVVFITSVLLTIGSVINYGNNFVNSHSRVLISSFSVLMTSVSLTSFLWHYFGFINEGNNDMIMITLSLLFITIAVYIYSEY